MWDVQGAKDMIPNIQAQLWSIVHGFWVPLVLLVIVIYILCQKDETINAEKYLEIIQEKVPQYMDIKNVTFFQQD